MYGHCKRPLIKLSASAHVAHTWRLHNRTVLKEPATGAGQSPEEMRILYVHSEADPELIRELSRQGHEVLSVGDRELPTRLLRVFEPHVVLVAASDVSQSCFALRREAPDVPIVAIVRGRDLDARIAALSCGADDCLSTPFDPAELLARINAATRTKAAPRVRVAGDQSLGGIA